MSDDLFYGVRVIVCFTGTVVDPVPDAHGQVRVRNDTDGDYYDAHVNDVDFEP